MVRHVILWKLKEELSEEEKKTISADIKKNLEALVGVVPTEAILSRCLKVR